MPCMLRGTDYVCVTCWRRPTRSCCWPPGQRAAMSPSSVRAYPPLRPVGLAVWRPERGQRPACRRQWSAVPKPLQYRLEVQALAQQGIDWIPPGLIVGLRATSSDESTTGRGREPIPVTAGFTSSQLGRRLCGNEVRKATGSYRPTSDAEPAHLATAKRPFAFDEQPHYCPVR